MSQKVLRPVLTGQRLKSRKRDEKEKFEPEVFREELVKGINTCEDKDAVSVYLDTAGQRLDYRRYAETLFDVLYASSIVAPGGSIKDDDVEKAKFCLFNISSDDREGIKDFMDLVQKVLRRYKFLQKSFQENVGKMMKYLKGFDEEKQTILAKSTAYCLSQSMLAADVLQNLRTEQQLKEQLALKFLTVVLREWTQLSSIDSLNVAMKKAHLDHALVDFMPLQRRNSEALCAHFTEEGMDDIVKYQRSKLTQKVKIEMGSWIKMSLRDAGDGEVNIPEMVQYLKTFVEEHKLPLAEAVSVVWANIMDGTDWNKKAELVQDQALRHIKAYVKLLETFTLSPKAELTLMVRIQNYCFDNQQFLKIFHRIILMLYKEDVIGEDAILKWYATTHSTKGKSAFNQQLKTMVEWLQSADTESEDEGEVEA